MPETPVVRNRPERPSQNRESRARRRTDRPARTAGPACSSIARTPARRTPCTPRARCRRCQTRPRRSSIAFDRARIVASARWRRQGPPPWPPRRRPSPTRTPSPTPWRVRCRRPPSAPSYPRSYPFWRLASRRRFCQTRRADRALPPPPSSATQSRSGTPSRVAPARSSGRTTSARRVSPPPAGAATPGRRWRRVWWRRTWERRRRDPRLPGASGG